MTHPHVRLSHLDAARGIASVRVIIVHFLSAVYGSAPGSFLYLFPFQALWYGEADMIFFFVHSGFVLSYAYSNRGWVFGLKYYLGFLLERIFRIYPLFLIVLFLSFLASNYSPAYNPGFSNWVSGLWEIPPSVKDFFYQSILVVRIPHESTQRLIVQDWTLTVELLAGAAIPILVNVSRRGFFVFLFTLGVLQLVGVFSKYVFEFGIGALLYSRWDEIKQYWATSGMLKKIVFLILVVTLYNCFFTFPSLFISLRVFLSQSFDQFIVAAGCTGLFIILLCSRRVQAYLSKRLFVILGRICYSMYLWHMMVIFLLWRYYPDYFTYLEKKTWHEKAGVFILYLMAVALLSLASYTLIEKPFNKLGKHITSKFVPKHLSSKV